MIIILKKGREGYFSLEGTVKAYIEEFPEIGDVDTEWITGQVQQIFNELAQNRIIVYQPRTDLYYLNVDKP